ncbi:hypothetical protein PUN28_013677 [Cardiocondyla obscurior]|uniref:Uncharacterized protein n=1 Tax=Cardiocondyla obscurior TaxID=286306 RepID=A0AAW2F2G2_9HYME
MKRRAVFYCRGTVSVPARTSSTRAKTRAGGRRKEPESRLRISPVEPKKSGKRRKAVELKTMITSRRTSRTKRTARVHEDVFFFFFFFFHLDSGGESAY